MVPPASPAMGDTQKNPMPSKARAKARQLDSAPNPMPKAKPRQIKLRMAAAKIQALDEVGEFMTDAFKEAGSNETMSRNDTAEFFWDWAEEAFWKARGGRPRTPEERAEKLRQEVLRVRADVAARDAEDLDA